MATIRLRDPGNPAEAAVPTNPSESLLTSLLKADKPIRHDCGGKALCGTCRVRVIEGGRALSPLRERERDRLAAAGAAEGERLACQAHAVRDVEIEPVLPSEPAGGAERTGGR